MARTFTVLLGITLFSAMLTAQSGPRGPLEGAWKVAEVVVTGADASNTPNPQPGLFVFTRTHYSIMYVPGNQPRALFKAQDPTTQEKIAAFDSFIANTGTYEVTGNTFTIRPMVARFPNFMAGGFTKYQFRIDGNNLSLTEKSTDENMRFGQRVVPWSGPVSETRMRLVRVE